MISEYLAFNDAIFEFFFNPDREGQTTTLGFDDTEARNIAESIGEEPGTYAARLINAVRALYREGGFTWWNQRSARERVALLACSVLMMSRLDPGEDASHGFYRRYNRDILGVESEKPPYNYQLHDNWWNLLQRYTNIEQIERLGRLVFLSVVGYTHLNFSASQCIFRGADRRWLREFFQRTCDPSTHLSRSGFLHLWKPGSQGETVGITRVGPELVKGGDFADGIWNIIAGEYEAWRKAPEQRLRIEMKRATRAAARASVKTASTYKPLQRLDQVAEHEATDGVLTIETRFTLQRPVFPAGQPYRLRLDALPPSTMELFDSGAFADGWHRVPDVTATAAQFVEGFRLEVEDDVELRVLPHEVACFVESASGLVSTNRLPLGERTVILLDEQVLPDFEELFQTCSIGEENLPLDPGLSGLCARIVDFPQQMDEVHLPDAMQAMAARSVTDLQVRSGLRLRGGAYLFGGVPIVTFNHPTIREAEIFIDAHVVGCAQRGKPFSLPNDVPPGTHLLGVLDQRRQFRIASEEEEIENQPDLIDDDLGFIARLRPPLMETSGKALSTRGSDLEAMNAVVVLGPELLLPYGRTDVG